MPLVVKCKKCRTVLYEGKEMKPPHEVIKQHDGRCPKCGRALSYEPLDMRIKKVKHIGSKLKA